MVFSFLRRRFQGLQREENQEDWEDQDQNHLMRIIWIGMFDVVGVLVVSRKKLDPTHVLPIFSKNLMKLNGLATMTSQGTKCIRVALRPPKQSRLIHAM
jgi:hypothetical protein